MPLSYGRPLWWSPRFRCDSSHEAPIVRNTNETPANAKPSTYQTPVTTSSCSVARRVVDDAPLVVPAVARGGHVDLATGTEALLAFYRAVSANAAAAGRPGLAAAHSAARLIPRAA